MASNNKKNGIPDRWLDYQAVGKRIPGTRFISFKVPLKAALNRRVSHTDVFGHWELLDVLEKEKLELGLILDLTFTTRYYKPEDVPDKWFHLKILTAGHEIPSNATILSFKRAVSRFLRENQDNDKLIGVHCTHGLNRTGYLVCRYLIDVDGIEPKVAVKLFNSSRGHSIERSNYLQDLHSGPKRSNKGMEVSEQEPVRGRSASRDHSILYSSDQGDDWGPPRNDRYRAGPLHPQEMNPWFRPYNPNGGGLLPPPPLLRPSNFPRPLLRTPRLPPPLMHTFGAGASLRPYQWGAPPPSNTQWRRPSHLESHHPRALLPTPERRSYPRTMENSGRSQPPQAPPYPLMGRYSPEAVRTNEHHGGSEDRRKDKKPRHRHTRRDRDGL
ncbi:RNA/RNP complex-1-interacting phosphatase [Aplochiton taeniatus]